MKMSGVPHRFFHAWLMIPKLINMNSLKFVLSLSQIAFISNSYLQCLRKEVEEEVYKSLVNKRLAAGEVILRV